MTLIKVDGLCKSFGEKTLFQDFSLEVVSGEFVSIMGESGAGKTTLLNIIGMLESPDKDRFLSAGKKHQASRGDQQHYCVGQKSLTLCKTTAWLIPKQLSITFLFLRTLGK